MKKAKIALTALMIGTMTVTGASFAEAGVKLDDVKIGIHFKNDRKPHVPGRHEAPRPPEAHHYDRHRGPHDAPPPPHPAKGHGPHFGHHHGPHGSGHHHHGHDVPPHHGGHR